MVLAAACVFCAVKLRSTYGFSILPDEFAYWAYAADAAGCDWSEVLSLGPYFSFGYSFLLYPLFLLCRDAVMAYRAAVGMNYLFLFITCFLLVRMGKKLIPDREMPVPLFAALAVFVPWNLVYAGTTMTETLLVLLYVAAGSLMLDYLERNRMSTLIWLQLSLTWLYLVHMRTVGIWLSAVVILTVHILLRGEKRWHLPVLAGVTAMLFVCTLLMKHYAISQVYIGSDPALLAESDYGGQMENLRYICTKDGFYDLIVTLIGGIAYLGLASFGLFYWGICGLGRHAAKLFCRIRKRESAAALEEMSCFLLMGTAAQIVIASVYLLQRGEIADYTYGRYSEYTLPLVLVMGFSVLWRERGRTALKAAGCFAAAGGAALWLAVCQIRRTGAAIFSGHFMIGISYLYEKAGFETARFYAGAWLLCVLLMLTVTTAVLTGRKSGRGQYLLIALALIQFVLAVRADTLYIAPAQTGARRDRWAAERLAAINDGNRRVIFMHDSGGTAYAGILQFMARDTEIRVMEHGDAAAEPDGSLLESDILIFAYDDEFSREWAQRYSHADTGGHFTLLYND